MKNANRNNQGNYNTIQMKKILFMEEYHKNAYDELYSKWQFKGDSKFNSNTLPHSHYTPTILRKPPTAEELAKFHDRSVDEYLEEADNYDYDIPVYEYSHFEHDSTSEEEPDEEDETSSSEYSESDFDETKEYVQPLVIKSFNDTLGAYSTKPKVVSDKPKSECRFRVTIPIKK